MNASSRIRRDKEVQKELSRDGACDSKCDFEPVIGGGLALKRGDTDARTPKFQ